MLKKYFLFFLMFLISSGVYAQAQNCRAKQRSQERTIKMAFKSGKITEREYYKLMQEQEAIKQTIEKYEADHYLTPHEKNVIHEKLVRAEKRLKRYKMNAEE